MAALDPRRLWRRGAGTDRSSGHHGGDQPLRRQLRRLPRPDVQHEHAGPPRLRDATPAQYLPKIVSGELRLQSMAVTEPTTGTDTTEHQDRQPSKRRPLCRQRPESLDQPRAALGSDDPARAHHAARPSEKEVAKACRSSSSIIRQAIGAGMTVRPIPNMVNHETNELFFDNLEIPAENLIGEEGQGFKYILTGLNAERALIAAECIGDGYWFIDTRLRLRQGAQSCSAGRSVRTRACSFPSPRPTSRWRRPISCGSRRAGSTTPASRAALKPTWPNISPRKPRGRRPTPACNFTAVSASPAEYDVERKFRETRLYQVAPISTNLILSYVAEHVLGLPRSF